MTPEPTPPAADATPVEFAYMLRPDRTATLPLAPVVAGRAYECRCPPAPAWAILAPYLTPGADLDLSDGPAGRRNASMRAVGRFFTACLRPHDLAVLKQAFRTKQATDAEVVDAVRLLLNGWWPHVELALPST